MSTATSATAPERPARRPEPLVPTRWTLIERIKDWDDHESWREFFAIYSPLIHKAACRAGLSASEAQEVVQETVLSICRNIKAFRADPKRGSFKNWMLTVTQWRIIDQLRGRHEHPDLRRQHRDELGRAGNEPRTATEEHVADPSGDALEKLWQAEWDQTLSQAALERLKQVVSPRQFQIFYLHVIRQQKPEEVMETLKVNRAQVYLAKHRAGRLFRKVLREIEQKAMGFDP